MGLAWSTGRSPAPHRGEVLGPLPPRRTQTPGSCTWEDLHPATRPSPPRFPSGVWLLLSPWDQVWLEAGMNSEGEPRMEVLLDNHHHNNPSPMFSISDPSAKSSCTHRFSESLPSPMRLPVSQVIKQKHRDLRTPMRVWSLNPGQRLGLQLQAPLRLKL